MEGRPQAKIHKASGVMEGISYLTTTSHTSRSVQRYLITSQRTSRAGLECAPQLTLAGDDVIPQKKERSVLWDGGWGEGDFVETPNSF